MTGLKAAVVRGVDVNMVNTVGWTPLHAAAAGGQLKTLRYLVKKMDADLSITDKGGNLPVHHAAKNGHVHALRTLQELGADITKVRLSQAKGKAVRELLAESYRKANKEEEDSDDDVAEAVGYARKQSKSTAFWGPRRTPISCAIKKKIIKDKRKLRKEKHKTKRECKGGTNVLDLESEKSKNEQEKDEQERGEQEPSYIETIQQIKRRRKQKRRQRQKLHTNAHINEKEDPFITNGIDRYEIVDSDDEDSDVIDDDDDVGFLASRNGQFAALALREDDSDSE